MYHFIVNPSSGSGSGAVLWKQIEKKLLEEQVSYVAHLTDGPDAAKRFAEEITKTDEEVTIVVCGGDGTMNEVMCGIRDFGKVILGCLPIGSSNDLIRDLGLKKDPMEMLKAILKPNRIISMDVGRVQYVGGEKKFSVSMGIGFDGAICHEALHSKIKDFFNKIKLGKLTYLFISLRQLAGMKKVGASIILDDEKVIHVDRVMFVTGMVHRYEGGGFMFCPEADYADGLLDILVVGDLSKLKVLQILPSARKGTHTRNSGMNTYRAKKVVIKTDVPLPVHADGESVGFQSEVTVTQEEKQVRFIV
ncbi:MAG: diacylglycerol kinase family lipid kinase [Lachnospiraceae bacterium]|nr:diacylglycerol kinase family lipid kinase [Lachnospiraceae bacterium]